jgi:uncharacterized protein (DUF885 family)
MRIITLAVFVAASLLLGACGKRPAPEPAAATPAAAVEAESASWPGLVEEFVADWLEAHPMMAFAAGRREFAGRFPDWSRAGLEAEVLRLNAMAERARGFDESVLSDAERFERDYLLAVIDRNLFWLESAEWPYRNPTFYFDWGLYILSPDPYLTKPYAPLDERMRGFTAWLEGLPVAAGQIRANLRTPMPGSWVEEGVASFGGMAVFLRDDAATVFAEVEDAALQAAFSEANAKAVAALGELAGWMESLRESATDDYALGPELFSEMLERTEGVDVSLERLAAIGRADLERNLEALDQACRDFAPGQDRKGCLARMNANRPEGGAVATARRQLDGLKAFVVEHELVSIPSDDPVFVDQAPPYQATNFAYIMTAGPYDVGMPSTYYIAPPDPSWPAEEQLAYTPGVADLMSTSAHEVWPGHFLQFLHSNRSDSIVGRLFVGYAFAEGWAHYAEEMMWEAGLSGGLPGGSAEFRIGQINKALYRNVRFICALGLHTQGMSVEECERLFREQAFQDPGNARQQAARGTYDPGYLNYTLGKLMIRKLREDWTAGRGGREAWGEFHDAFLSYGGPPIPMLRREMLGDQAGPAL